MIPVLLFVIRLIFRVFVSRRGVATCSCTPYDMFSTPSSESPGSNLLWPVAAQVIINLWLRPREAAIQMTKRLMQLLEP